MSAADAVQPPSRGRVLVTGASIAGPAAAYWLERVGYDVTVLERAAEPREGGQNIDVRGLAKNVLARMGLLDAVRDAGTGEVGTRFVAEDGSTIAEFAAGDGSSGDGPTAELEILRGELARLLRDACGDRVAWRTGDQVVALDQDGDAVTVRLAGGGEETYDLLVVAEGSGSRTRGLLLGDGADDGDGDGDSDDAPELRRLGMQMVWGTIPRTKTDDDWWRWLSVAGSRSVTLRPDNQGTTRATVAFMTDEPGFETLDRPAQHRELRARFDDLGWEVPRVLDALESSDDLYVEDLTQVRCPTWVHGRVVLLGDAAWCVTPIAGAGTSLALIGAQALAAYLSQTEPGVHPSRALTAWEEWTRPLVEDAQDLPPGTPRVANPESRLGVTLLRAGIRVAASRPVRALAERLTSDPDTERALPEVRTSHP